MRSHPFSEMRTDKHDAFAIPDFSAARKNLFRAPAPLDDIFDPGLDLKLEPVNDVKLPDTAFLGGKDGAALLGYEQWLDLDLPPLEDLRLDEDPEFSDQSASEISLEPLDFTTPPQTGFEDAWHAPEVFQELPPRCQLLSWEAFGGKKSEEPQPSFLSEAGAAAFDAALVVRARNRDGSESVGNAVKVDVLLRSLWQLGFGRESVLFPFDADKGDFAPAIEDVRASGYSFETSTEVIDAILELGRRVRDLKRFAEIVFDGSHTLPARVALASAVGDVLSTMEDQLMDANNEMQTLLQLQAAFEPLKALSHAFKDLEQQTNGSTTDADVLSRTFEYLQANEDGNSSLQDVLQEAFKRIAQQWLEKLEIYTGLRSTSVAPNPPEDDLAFPTFVLPATIALIQETHRLLIFDDKNQQPDQQLVGVVWPCSDLPFAHALQLSIMRPVSRQHAQLTSAAMRSILEHAPFSAPGPSLQSQWSLFLGLPAGMCFAVRYDMAPDTISMLDPGNASLHALDSLQLVYSPPPDLATLFTPRVLAIYADVFGFWLRASKVTNAMNVLWADRIRHPSGSVLRREDTNMTRRVAVEAKHLFGDVLACMRSFIDEAWSTLLTKVESLEMSTGGLELLHYAVLEQISGVCLLRKGQSLVLRQWEGAAQSFLDFVNPARQLSLVEAGGRFLEQEHEFVLALQNTAGAGGDPMDQKAVEKLLDVFRGTSWWV